MNDILNVNMNLDSDSFEHQLYPHLCSQFHVLFQVHISIRRVSPLCFVFEEVHTTQPGPALWSKVPEASA